MLFATLAEQLCGSIVDPQTDSVQQLERALFNAIQDATGRPRPDVFSFTEYGYFVKRTGWQTRAAQMKDDMARRNVGIANLSVDDLGLFVISSKALRLSTIHYAKGRGYTAMAIINLREGSLQDYRPETPDDIAGRRSGGWSPTALPGRT